MPPNRMTPQGKANRAASCRSRSTTSERSAMVEGTSARLSRTRPSRLTNRSSPQTPNRTTAASSPAAAESRTPCHEPALRASSRRFCDGVCVRSSDHESPTAGPSLPGHRQGRGQGGQPQPDDRNPEPIEPGATAPPAATTGPHAQAAPTPTPPQPPPQPPALRYIRPAPEPTPRPNTSLTHAATIPSPPPEARRSSPPMLEPT